jgi:hypothetical protein
MSWYHRLFRSEPLAAPTKELFVREMIYLPDFTRVLDTIGNRRFEQCLIRGPAVLISARNNQLLSCKFDGPLEAILWEIPLERTCVIGVIALLDCIFDRCQFVHVGLAGPPEFIAMARQGFRSEG